MALASSDKGGESMGLVKEPELVTPVASVFSADEDLLRAAEVKLSTRLGKCCYKSGRLKLLHTDYYEEEMGPSLIRYILAFERLMDPSELVELKLWSNELEAVWSSLGQRLINIDVGYVTMAKLVLATTKDHAHRLYLGRGIYGEVTLHFVNGKYEPWPFTYPDYATSTYREIFGSIRQIHRDRLRNHA